MLAIRWYLRYGLSYRDVEELLADLAERGLDASGGLLFVLDGAKALAKGVRKVFGEQALVQRCTVHKRRNVAEHLPERERELIDAKLVRAFGHPDPILGQRAARDLAASLDRTHPSAANSIREGLTEMFTVRRLGLSEGRCCVDRKGARRARYRAAIRERGRVRRRQS